MVKCLSMSRTLKLAIMQPTFLPWIGYFSLIDYVDMFVFLDDVQCSRQTFQTRNRIKTSQGIVTISIPCKRKRAMICDTVINNPAFYRKAVRTIQLSLSKAPYVDQVINLLQETFSSNYVTLGELNRALIEKLMLLLGINTPCTVASTLNVLESSKTDRLLKFCNKFGASEYVSAPRAFEYLRQHDPFCGTSINLSFFQFEHPEYPQLYGEFVSHLSIVDAIANLGPVETLSLMRAAVRPSLTFDEISTR